MGFEFGMLGGLDLETTMYSLCIVICFICIFEFATGVLEYSLEEHPLYNRMVQNIYKELMQMGLISFIIVLYESRRETNQWLLSIDFSHMLLFFVALFFVVHAFFLMFLSYRSSKYYLKLNAQTLKEVLTHYTTKTRLESFLFWLPYLSLSELQDSMEYKIAHLLFRDTYYRLPREFNFSLYLTKCLDYYALKTMEVGYVSWIFVAILVVANYVRVQFQGPFTCVRSTYFRRNLAEASAMMGSSRTANQFSGVQSHIDGINTVANEMTMMMYSEAAEYGDDDGSHDDGSHGGSSSGHHLKDVPHSCSYMYMQMFCASAILLVIYILIVLFIGRIYKRRLLRRVGLQGPNQYAEFLDFCREADESMSRSEESENESFRLSPPELRAVIEEFLDVKEHNDEKKLYRQTVELISTCAQMITDGWYKLFMYLRYYVGMSRKGTILDDVGGGFNLLLEGIGQRMGQVVPDPSSSTTPGDASLTSSQKDTNTTGTVASTWVSASRAGEAGNSDKSIGKDADKEKDKEREARMRSGKGGRDSFVKKSKLNQFEKRSIAPASNSIPGLQENNGKGPSSPTYPSGTTTATAGVTSIDGAAPTLSNLPTIQSSSMFDLSRTNSMASDPLTQLQAQQRKHTDSIAEEDTLPTTSQTPSAQSSQNNNIEECSPHSSSRNISNVDGSGRPVASTAANSQANGNTNANGNANGNMLRTFSAHSFDSAGSEDEKQQQGEIRAAAAAAASNKSTISIGSASSSIAAAAAATANASQKLNPRGTFSDALNMRAPDRVTGNSFGSTGSNSSGNNKDKVGELVSAAPSPTHSAAAANGKLRSGDSPSPNTIPFLGALAAQGQVQASVRKVSFGGANLGGRDDGNGEGNANGGNGVRRTSTSSKRSGGSFGESRRFSLTSTDSGADGNSTPNRPKLNSVDQTSEAVVHAKLSIHKKMHTMIMAVAAHGSSAAGADSSAGVHGHGAAAAAAAGTGGGGGASGRTTLAQARKIRGLTAVLGTGTQQTQQTNLRTKIHAMIAKQQIQKQFELQQQHTQQQSMGSIALSVSSHSHSSPHTSGHTHSHGHGHAHAHAHTSSHSNRPRSFSNSDEEESSDDNTITHGEYDNMQRQESGHPPFLGSHGNNNLNGTSFSAFTSRRARSRSGSGSSGDSNKSDSNRNHGAQSHMHQHHHQHHAGTAPQGIQARRASLVGLKDRNNAMIMLEDGATSSGGANASGAQGGSGAGAARGRRRSVLGSATTILTQEEAVAESIRHSLNTVHAANSLDPGDGTGAAGDGTTHRLTAAALAELNTYTHSQIVSNTSNDSNRVPTVVGSYLYKKSMQARAGGGAGPTGNRARTGSQRSSFTSTRSQQSQGMARTSARLSSSSMSSSARTGGTMIRLPQAKKASTWSTWGQSLVGYIIGRGTPAEEARKVNPDPADQQNQQQTGPQQYDEAEVETLSEDFTDIFILKSPWLFYRAAELGIMMNCLYMGLWSTNFISITLQDTEWTGFWNILMVLPIFVSIWCIGQISLICSLLKAITEVDSNLNIICEVIVDMEDRSVLMYELKEKVLSKIECFDNQREIFQEIYKEIDVDGSNSINKFEFREFLRLLELKYSDARFNRLFRALDRNGSDSLSFDDLASVLFDEEDD